MEMNFHSQQKKTHFHKKCFALSLNSLFQLLCMKERVLTTRKWSILQLNRGFEIIYVMQRHTDNVDVTRVLIIEDQNYAYYE